MHPPRHKRFAISVGALKNESNAKHSRGGRLRRIVVIAQVTLSLVLLVSAGIFLRSLQRASTVDAGFNPNDRLALGINQAGAVLSRRSALTRPFRTHHGSKKIERAILCCDNFGEIE